MEAIPEALGINKTDFCQSLFISSFNLSKVINTSHILCTKHCFNLQINSNSARGCSSWAYNTNATKYLRTLFKMSNMHILPM